jgi:hypothetical protein
MFDAVKMGCGPAAEPQAFAFTAIFEGSTHTRDSAGPSPTVETEDRI